MFIRILRSSASTCWLTVLSSVVAQILCSLWFIEGAVFSFTHVFCTIGFFFGCPGYKISENRDVAWFQGSWAQSFMEYTGCFMASHLWTSDPPITTAFCSHPIYICIQQILKENHRALLQKRLSLAKLMRLDLQARSLPMKVTCFCLVVFKVLMQGGVWYFCEFWGSCCVK